MLSDVLFLGTGALMNPLSINQGQHIPGIAHLVRIRGIRKSEIDPAPSASAQTEEETHADVT